ncbi:hypothetical protein FYK55_00420 [Roseiconus nitratireducens]|uniref:Uncharacterized protein n=1 Tax=Roseiconus nitratireducens TaxID=2605748 RepID=A0A5M6DHA4_9BACT|nr:hypothetical protein [Roseiconus nitratireducens]KAA5546924.1 hypothetical protein FYK55_00420 [Roseiconus nitratireducens]
MSHPGWTVLPRALAIPVLEKLRLTAIDLLTHYWIQCLALIAFGFCAWRLWPIRPIEHAIPPAVLAVYGLVATVAPDEVSDWTGNYGWTTQQYRNTPPVAIQAAGVVSMIAAVIYLL